MVELLNETVNETVNYAVGVIQHSPPSPQVGLTGNLILMIIGLFILAILYIKFKKLGRTQQQAQQQKP